MNIAYILSSLANAGPIIVAYDLVQLMVKAGHKACVFYFDDKIELDFPCPTKRITMKSHLDFKKFDVVHCHGLRPDLFVFLHKPLFCKTPVCTTIHSYLFQDHAYKYGRWKSKITGRLVLSSVLRDDKVIVLSKHAQVYYERYLPIRKLAYAYNTRICDFSQELDKQERTILEQFQDTGDVLIGANCGLHSLKGLDVIIRALALLPKNYKLCIVGGGPARKEWEQLVADLGLAPRVLFMGRRPMAYRFLPYYDVYAMPSRSEGFPLAMLEAAACGKAVVCSDIPIFKEILASDEVEMFKLDNVEEAAGAIKAAAVHKDTLGNKIRARFEKDYSPQRLLERHLHIYQSLINEKKNHLY